MIGIFGVWKQASSAVLANNFQTQFYVPTSPLRSGVVTSNVDTTVAPLISTVLLCTDGSYQTVCPPIAAGFDYLIVAIAAAGLVVLAVAGVLLWKRGGLCFRKDHMDLEVFT